MITMTGGVDIYNIEFQVASGFVPSASYYNYELYDGGTLVYSGKVAKDMTTDYQYLGFSGGGYDTIALSNTETAYANATDGTWQALGIDSIQVQQLIQPVPEPVAIDIKPKHCPNKLEIKKRNNGKLKVAILGTDTFNVRDIDKSTIRLEGEKPVKTRYRDITAPASEIDNYPCFCEVFPADTYEDLVLYFKKKDIVDALGDVNNGDEIPLTLTAKLTDDVTEIEGSDCVLIKKKNHKKKKKKKH